MIARSGAWCKAIRSSAHDFVLANGSRAKASPTFGGRAYINKYAGWALV